jgi:DNA-directed RNA polymerase subunit RPC12/RpoP
MWKILPPSEVKPVRTGELRCADCGYSTRITHWFEWEIQDGTRGFCPSCGSRKTSVAKVGEERSAHAMPDPPKNPPYDPYKHIILSGPSFPDLPKKDLREPHAPAAQEHTATARGPILPPRHSISPSPSRKLELA